MENRSAAENLIEDEESVDAPGPDSKVLGEFEVRPSYTSAQGEFHTENTLELGYQIRRDLKVSYVQFFNTNLYDPKSGNPVASQFGFAAQDGFLRTKIDDIWLSGDRKTSFSFQGRVYMPTLAAVDGTPSRYDQGMVSFIRTYFKLARELSNSVSVDLSFTPGLYLFTKPGWTTKFANGTPNSSANPIYENMFILNADIKIAKNLTFSIPIITEITRYRSYAEDAQFNNRWGYNIWFWPELDWEISSNQTVGLAFYSDNFVADDLSGVHIGTGLKNGITQVLWNVKL